MIEEDYMASPRLQRGSVASVLSVSQRSRGSVASSTSTHRGGSLHIAGFGEAHDFRYDDDGAKLNKINGTNSMIGNGTSLMESERENPSGIERSRSEGELNTSRDSQGNPLTGKQRQSRIQAKMKKK